MHRTSPFSNQTQARDGFSRLLLTLEGVGVQRLTLNRGFYDQTPVVAGIVQLIHFVSALKDRSQSSQPTSFGSVLVCAFVSQRSIFHTADARHTVAGRNVPRRRPAPRRRARNSSRDYLLEFLHGGVINRDFC